MTCSLFTRANTADARALRTPVLPRVCASGDPAPGGRLHATRRVEAAVLKVAVSGVACATRVAARSSHICNPGADHTAIRMPRCIDSACTPTCICTLACFFVHPGGSQTCHGVMCARAQLRLHLCLRMLRPPRRCARMHSATGTCALHSQWLTLSHCVRDRRSFCHPRASRGQMHCSAPVTDSVTPRTQCFCPRLRTVIISVEPRSTPQRVHRTHADRRPLRTAA